MQPPGLSCLLFDPMDNSRKQIISLAIAIALMVLSALWIARAVVRFSNLQMDFDEAIHATRGLDFTSAALRGNLFELWQHFIKPEWYPPGHGILLGGWFLFTGVSIETVRLFSTFFYFLFGLLLWVSVREILPHGHPLVFLVPPLFLIADRLHAIYGALSMLEIPAITLSFAGLYFFNRAWRKKRFVDHLLAFLFAWLALFSKYNFGLVVFAAFAIGYVLLLWPLFKTGKVWPETRPVLATWILFLLIAGIWFFGLGHWRWLFEYAGARPERYTLWSWANFLYYPRMLTKDPLGWVAIGLSVVGGIKLIRQRSFPHGLIPYLAFFAISLVMLTLTLYKIPRFGMMLFPPLWMTAAIGAEVVIDDPHPKWLRTASYIALALAMLLAGTGNLASFQAWLFKEYENANAGVDNAYRFIAETLDISNQKELDIVMLGRTDLWNGPALRFHLEAQCMFTETGCKIIVLDSRELRRGWPEQNYSEEEQKERRNDALASADYLILFSEQLELPDGWELVTEGEYTFERQSQKPAFIWVSIFGHQPAQE